MALMKLKHAVNKLNLERQRRQFQEEENKRLRAEIAVADNVQRRLGCQEEENGKCKIVYIIFLFIFQSVSGVYTARNACGSPVKYTFYCDFKEGYKSLLAKIKTTNLAYL